MKPVRYKSFGLLEITILAVATAAFFSLLNWVFSWGITIGPQNSKPIAFSTSILIFLLASSLFLIRNGLDNRIGRIFIFFSVGLTVITSIAVAMRIWLNLGFDVEQAFYSIKGMSGSSIAWKMSYITAPAMFLLSLVIVSLCRPFRENRNLRQIGAVLGIIVSQ